MRKLSEFASDNSDNHIVVSIINGIGDGFLALPVIRYIIDQFGGDRVTVWARASYKDTVFSELGSIFIPTSVTAHSDKVTWKQEIGRLREFLPDRNLIWVNLNAYYPDVEAEAEAIGSLKPIFVYGFNQPNILREAPRRPLLHRIDQYFRVIGECGMPPGIIRTPTLPLNKQKIGLALRARAVSQGKSLVVFHMQTAERKQWPHDKWENLATRISARAQIVVVGKDIAPSLDNICPAGPFEWLQQAAIVAHAHRFVGIDSSWAHVADSFGIAGGVLFGPTSPTVKQWGPRGSHLSAIIAPGRALSKLSVEAVLSRAFLEDVS